jgi:hypothetical protein|nr:MAG TPA: hypothetical protein [Caudoviricetes sp.]
MTDYLEPFVVSEKPLASLAKDLVVLDECCSVHTEEHLVSHKLRPQTKACKLCVENKKIAKTMEFGGLPDWTVRDENTGQVVRYNPQNEESDGDIISDGEFKQTKTSLSDILAKFKAQKGYDLEKSGVIEFAYEMESLEKLEAFQKWVIEKFRGEHKHVEKIMVHEYLSMSKNAYMSPENKQRLIDKKGAIERSEMVIVDNLGDYSPDEQSQFLSLMRMLQNKKFILYTFADADDRLDKLPTSVKFAIKGNRMAIL